jgi:hypothetical protein
MSAGARSASAALLNAKDRKNGLRDIRMLFSYNYVSRASYNGTGNGTRSATFHQF